MPYKIYPSGDEFKVCKKNEDGSAGECVGTHKTRKEAVAQQRALYASENKELLSVESKMQQLDQGHTQYTPLSSVNGQACANCMFFRGSDSWNPCMLVEDYPIGIEPTGWCNEWREIVVREPDPMKVVVVSETKEFPEASEGAVRKALRSLVDLLSRKKSDEGFVGFKVIPGSNRWVGIWSNNFQDKVKEIFPYAVQDVYVERVKAGQTPYPTLRFWHVKGTDISRADAVGRIGNFMWASGEFWPDAASQAMKEYLAENGPWGMSHGFRFYKSLLVNGVYRYFNTFEVSVLPPDAACNPYTLFDGGVEMKATAEQQAALASVLGEDLAKSLVSRTDAEGERLEASGVEHRSLNDPAPTLVDASQISEQIEVMGKAILSMAESIKAVGEARAEEASFRTSVNERLNAIETAQKNLLGLTPPASQHSQTLMSPNNPALSLLKQNMDAGSGQKSVLDMVLEQGVVDVRDIYGARNEGVPPTQPVSPAGQ